MHRPFTYVFSSTVGATRKMLAPVVRTTKHLSVELAGQVVVASATGSVTDAKNLDGQRKKTPIKIDFGSAPIKG